MLCGLNWSCAYAYITHPLFSILIGSLVTWLVAYFYYKKAGDELFNESKRLRDLTQLILVKLSYPEQDYSPKHNEKGEIVGFFGNASTKLVKSKK